ncbi:hypothetical protein [Rhodococcus kronopolitis]|uniref:Anti-sigma-M factor RsmA n=1 Tax=Rhodococcus kronopolitis TaxID=1460226 RepID=A0ABV9FPS6_9NOCA
MVAQGEDALHPPFDPDLLADLHAGALPPEFADRLRVASAPDPEAQRVLAALDSVRGQLGALRTSDVPPPPAPPDVVARIEAALAAEGAAAPATVSPLAGRTARRRRPVRLLAAAAAVAVVAAGALFALTRADETRPATPTVALHAPTPSGTGVDLGSDLNPATVLGLLGSTDLGPLSVPEARDGCLRANGVDPTTPLLGSGPVRLRGVPGLLMLFPGAQLPQITALVVGMGCTDSDPATLARADIG